VHKFGFTLVINEKKNAAIETHVLTGYTCLPPTIIASVKGLYPRFKVNCILLSKRLYWKRKCLVTFRAIESEFGTR
jgi:hypothetical protein